MKYCKSCVMPNTKPGVYFDEEGNCNACRNMKIKKKKLIGLIEKSN